MSTGREHCQAIFEAAVAAVQPGHLIAGAIQLQENTLCICGHQIQLSQHTKIIVIGAGKASAAMAKAVEAALDKRISTGLVTTKYHHSLPLQHIDIIEAAHPVPDKESVSAVKRTIELLEDTGSDDIIICLLSGGASSLWTDLPGGISLTDLQQTFKLLLQSGASIHEMNTVRKHLSAIKGGQLPHHAKFAHWFTLIISDVPGDDLSVIASGPTVADETRFADAKKVLDNYSLWEQLPASVAGYLQAGLNGEIAETAKPADASLQQVRNCIIGSNERALSAAAKKATELGYHPLVIDPLLQGDASKAAKKLWDQYKSYSGTKPVCMLTGGETTVQVKAGGKGGRNQHMVLEMLQQMINDKTNDIYFLAAGTDGTDGPTDAAGAFADKDVVDLVKKKDLDSKAYLANNDSYSFFEQTGALLKTGATQTNVMDITVCIIQ